MSDFADLLGNPVSAAEPAARTTIDDFSAAFLAYEARAGGIVKAAAGGEAGALVSAYAGILFMLLESPQGPARARPFLAAAERAAEGGGANARERATIAFLRAWLDDDVPRARALSEAIVAEWPRDLVMLKLNAYLAFTVGDFPAMLRTALSVAGAAADVPYLHGMTAFAYEQCHLLDDAEAAAGRALAMTGREPWAQHALAHVMLTQGRIDEGARFMAGAAPSWTGLNSFMVTHNWWHQALFGLSQGRDAAVLAIYDDQCWAGDHSYSQDQVGAVSLLARLELAGVDVGERWGPVADELEARGADVEQPFLTLQYLYGLARAGRTAAAEGLMAAIRRRAAEAPAWARTTWAEVAAPAAEGISAHLAGDHGTAIGRLGPVLPRMAEVGGSHAQRDLFDQIVLASALADRRWTSAQQALELRRGYDPDGVPVNRALARVYAALALPDLAARAAGRAEATLARAGA